MLLLQALAGRHIKLWKTTVIVPEAAESAPLQGGSPGLAVLQGNISKALSLLL